MRKYRNKALPRGIQINKEKVWVRMFADGKEYLECFGPVTPEHIDDAIGKLNQLRQAKRQGKLNLDEKEGRVRVGEAIDLFYKKHFLENPQRKPQSRLNAKYVLDVLSARWGNRWIDEITYLDVLKFRSGFKAVSTANRHNALITSLFNRLEEYVELKFIRPIALPSKNPGLMAEKYLRLSNVRLAEDGRERIPSLEELQQACEWCLHNDPDLWNAIEQAIVTTQRKADLMAVQKTGRVEGVQAKTGRRFFVPVSFERPANFVNFRRRWNALRVAMGWQERGKATHTTWHDLRHVGPTMLAEMGYSTRVIKEMTGHATESQVERYINPSKTELLQPAVESLQRRLAAIRGGVAQSSPQTVAKTVATNLEACPAEMPKAAVGQ